MPDNMPPLGALDTILAHVLDHAVSLRSVISKRLHYYDLLTPRLSMVGALLKRHEEALRKAAWDLHPNSFTFDGETYDNPAEAVFQWASAVHEKYWRMARGRAESKARNAGPPGQRSRYVKVTDDMVREVMNDRPGAVSVKPPPDYQDLKQALPAFIGRAGGKRNANATGAEEWIDRKEAAKILDVTVDRVRQLEKEGKLTPKEPRTGKVMYRKSEVKALAKERKQKSRRKKAAPATREQQEKAERFIDRYDSDIKSAIRSVFRAQDISPTEEGTAFGEIGTALLRSFAKDEPIEHPKAFINKVAKDTLSLQIKHRKYLERGDDAARKKEDRPI